MQRMRVSSVVLVVLALVVTAIFVGAPQVLSQQARPTRNRVLERQALEETGRLARHPKRMRLSGGVLATYLEATGRLPVAAGAGPALAPPGVRLRTLGCARTREGAFDNVRVNQDCSLRRQAEEFIAINPTDSNNLVAGQNDSWVGFNHCGIDFSFNRGRTWGSISPPFWQFQQGDGHVPDAGSDPAVTFDAIGNAYFECIIFNVSTPANSLVVTKSNAAHGGSFFHTPAPIAFQEFFANPLGVVATNTESTIFNDKNFMNADRGAASPKKNNIYTTWTRFNDATGAGVGGNSPIYFSQSTNGGATWSAGIEISGANAAICTVFSGSSNPNACDQDQGSWPVAGPDGTVYVIFGNGNTPDPGINQVLVVKCAPNLDCSSASSWSPPSKVGDLIGTHPIGPSAAGCPAGRQCLPPNGYRVPEFTSMSLSVDATTGKLYAVWADHRNGDDPGSTCGPFGSAATRTPPCDHDIFLATSINGGVTWSATVEISGEGGAKAAQWQPWSALAPNGTLYVAFYDRKYGVCETTGCNDITLGRSTNGGLTFTYFRLSTSSMPNLTPTNNPAQAGFLGDYMGVDADANGAVIVWGDTRGRLNTVEEDIYFVNFPASTP